MKILCIGVNSKYSHSSLALRYFKEYAGCDIFECSINDDIFSVYSKLAVTDYDAFMFGIYIWNREYVIKLISMIKSTSDAVIYAGGPEAGYDSENILRKVKDIDFVITGEGEQTIKDIKDSVRICDIPNLVYLEDGKIVKNRREFFDLSKMKFPYKTEDLKELKNKIIYFETSRGCLFNCSYCLSSSQGRTRYFSMDYVKDGIKFFIENNVPLVKFVDRTFNDSKERSCEILEYIIDNNKNTHFHFEIAPSLICDEFIDLLKRSEGKIQIEAGIQTTNKETMKAIGRVYDINKIRENLMKIPDCVHLHTDLIAGLPYETCETFKKGFDYAYSMKPNMLQLGFLKLLKNTRLMADADKYGIVTTQFPPFEVLETAYMSKEDIISLKKTENALDRLYNSGMFFNTLEKICTNPFEFYEKMGNIIWEREKEGPLSREGLCTLLFETFGEKIRKPLICDILTNNPKSHLPTCIYQNTDKKVFKAFCGYEKFKNKKIRVEKCNGGYLVLCEGKIYEEKEPEIF